MSKNECKKTCPAHIFIDHPTLISFSLTYGLQYGSTLPTGDFLTLQEITSRLETFDLHLSKRYMHIASCLIDDLYN